MLWGEQREQASRAEARTSFPPAQGGRWPGQWGWLVSVCRARAAKTARSQVQGCPGVVMAQPGAKFGNRFSSFSEKGGTRCMEAPFCE